MEPMNELELKIAKAICELNRFETPIHLQAHIGRELTDSEIKIAMRTLSAYVPYEKWIRVWQDQIQQAKFPDPSKTPEVRGPKKKESGT